MKVNVIITFSFTFVYQCQGRDVFTTLMNDVKYVCRRGQFYCEQEYDTSLIHRLLYTRMNQGYVTKNKTISKEQIKSHKL